jgi:branched-subunit amino acid aminotransferase/4-amino-4-deoxychorismate lyase
LGQANATELKRMAINQRENCGRNGNLRCCDILDSGVYCRRNMRINCVINGREVTRNRAKIPIFDNSLFYADGLFETFLAVKGAKLVNISLPYKRETIRKWICLANQRNKARIKKIRVTVTAGDSGFWAGTRSNPRILIIVTDYKIPSEPFKLCVSPFRVDQDSPFRNVKTLAFIIEMTSRKQAYSCGFDDGILLNRAGNVAETTSANIFWVKDGRLFTPPLNSGCLEGMTRKHILELAERHGIPVTERDIGLGGLIRADEIFVTSSLKIILPVALITTSQTYRYKYGPVTKKLRSLLLDYILKPE